MDGIASSSRITSTMISNTSSISSLENSCVFDIGDKLAEQLGEVGNGHGGAPAG